MRPHRRLALRVIAIAAIVMAGLVAWGTDAASAGATTATISGGVADLATSAPLAGVTVTATPTSTGHLSSTTTAADGAYTLTVVPGTYTICFDGSAATTPSAPLGYAEQCYLEGTALTVTAGDQITGIDVQLSPAGEITGRVTDASGNPLAGVRVGQATTGVDGTYVEHLSPGYYTVCFDPSDATGGTSKAGYLQQCYGGGYGTGLFVTAGQVTSGIDAALQSASRITGRVTDTAGRPVSGVQIYAYGTNGWGQATTDSNGRYTTTPLYPGYYGQISFGAGQATGPAPAGYLDTCVCSGKTLVAGQVAHLNVTLTLGAGIAGTVEDTHGAPIPHVVVNVDGYQVATTGADGTYTAERLTAGPHTVCFRAYGITAPSPNGYVDQCYDDAQQCCATTVPTTAGVITPGIDAALVGRGSISGRITDTKGNPLGYVYVEVTNTQTGGGQTSTALDGTYLIRGLEPGTYTECLQLGSQVVGGSSTTGYPPNFCLPGTITVAADQDVTGVNAQVPAAGRIRGTVTDRTGKPLANVSVSLDGTPGVYTDAHGRYVLTDVAPGTHTVCFSTDTFVTSAVAQFGFAAACYANNAPEDSPTPVTVRAGAYTSGIDDVLQANGEIKGTVRYSDGTPAGETTVILDGLGPLTYSDAATGAYAIIVPPGTHTVCFYPAIGTYQNQCYDGVSISDTPTPVTVRPNHVTGSINATLQPS